MDFCHGTDHWPRVSLLSFCRAAVIAASEGRAVMVQTALMSRMWAVRMASRMVMGISLLATYTM